MSSGNAAFTKDARFSLLHQPGDTDWTLGIKYLQQRDEGTYVCQVSNIIFYTVNIYGENTILYNSDYDQLVLALQCQKALHFILKIGTNCYKTK